MAKKLSPADQKASLGVLGELRKLAQDEMKGKMANLKKVTVASDSKEGLKKGLEKAEEVLESKCPECEGEECECESEEYESEEAPEAEESEELSEEEIDAKIKELMALKAKKK